MPTIHEMEDDELVTKMAAEVEGSAVKLLKIGLEELPENLRSDIYCEAILRACAKMITSYGASLSVHLIKHCEDNYEWSSKRLREWGEQMRSGKQAPK